MVIWFGWVITVWGPLNQQSCLKFANTWLKQVVYYSDMNDNIIPIILAIIVLYVFNVFGKQDNDAHKHLSENNSETAISRYERNANYFSTVSHQPKI